MDWTKLKDYLDVESDQHNEFIQTCWDNAQALLTLATARAFRPVPQTVMDEMTLEVGKELFSRKSATSSGSQFATYDGGSIPVRGPRDPLAQVRPILAMFVVPL